MAHPIHKIVGPMLNKRPPATVEEVTKAVYVEGVGYRFVAVVAREWINEAKRKNGQLGSSEIAGREFRKGMRTHKNRRGRIAPQAVPVKSPSRLQRIARAITRMFRK